MPGPLLSVLVPVLARPHNAAPLADSLRDSTSVSYECLFLCSPGDDDEIEACRETGARVHVCEWSGGPGDYARKINLGYELTSSEFLFMGADDLRFEPGWDEAVLQVADQTGAGVIGTNDLANPEVMKGRHATHFLIRRSYAEQGCTVDGTGQILHTGYDHQCIDLELLETARARGQWAMALDSHVRHLHPVFDRSVQMDSTYERALSKGQEDRRLFFQRRHLWTPELRQRERRRR